MTIGDITLADKQIDLHAGANDLAQIVKTFMDRAETVESLNSYYKKNEEMINKIKDIDKTIYDDLIDAFKKHKEKILALPSSSSLSDS